MATKMLKIIFPFLMLPLIQMNQSGVQKDVTINTVEIKTDATDDENIQEGSNITLTCSANIIIPPDQRSQILHLFYKGEKKDILLQNASSNGLSSKYILQSARASHSGYYSCVVEAGSKRKESDTTFITVKGNLQTPRLTIHPMNVTLGDSIELCCTSEEIPPLTFIFYKYKDGQKPQRFSDVKSNNKSAMHQLKVAVNTEKAYSCKVEVNGISAHSENSQMVQITVRDPFPDPIIKIEPSKGIFEGDNLTIKCVVHFILFPDIQPEITIVKDITSIATNATVAVFTKKATANDTGEYKCMAQWNDALKITKRHVIVKVPVSEPTLKSTPTGDNVVAGETLNLSCAVLKGTYPITYNFYKATSEAPLHQITLNATEAVHRIISVNIENQGRYSCEASNTANQINRTERSQYVNISVKVPVSNPTIKCNSLKGVYKTGELVTLLCQSTTGTLPITYSLFLNKRFIYSVTRSNREPAAFNVLINETKDGGEYKCKAENEIPDLFKYSEGMNFTVKVPVSTPLLYPLLNSTEVKLGETVALHCITSAGTPPITYTLYRNQSSLQTVSTMQAIPTAFNITIETMKHSGEYRCEADNQISSQWSNRISFHILIPVSTPLLYPLLNSTEVKLGETVTLHCITSTGTPPITYTLYRNQSSLQTVSTMQAIPTVFNITIETVEHSGEYRCEAENQISSQRSNGISFHILYTSWWLYITVLVPLVLIATAAVLAFGLRRQCKNNKDIRQADESDEIRQREPSQNNQGSLKESMEVVYSKIGKIIRPRTDSDWNHEGDYTNIVLPKGNGIDPESDCEGDYTNVTSKRKAANADSDSCSDESDGVHYIQIDLAALQTQNMSQPEGPTIYASIALNKLR
ncbi:platelet endothelial cell adhesion molecule isoform X2 [Mustelus asterias]